jgi:hypothetical protein
MADIPCHLRVPIVLKSGSLNLEPSGPVQPCNGIALLLLLCLPLITTFLLTARGFTSLPQRTPVATSLRVKRPGCGVQHPPASRVEAENDWCYTFALPYATMSCTGANFYPYL